MENVTNSRESVLNRKVSCEIYSRVSGFYRPVSQFNKGKKEEFKERKTLLVPQSIIEIK